MIDRGLNGCSRKSPWNMQHGLQIPVCEDDGARPRIDQIGIRDHAAAASDHDSLHGACDREALDDDLEPHRTGTVELAGHFLFDADLIFGASMFRT